MRKIVVVSNPSNWPLDVDGVEVVQARTYLTDMDFVRAKARVFNLCRSYRYQSTGYYVSLLAEARGHRPIPDIITLRDLQMPSLYRTATSDLDQLIQQSFSRLVGDTFVLSIYFGRNLARRYDRLSLRIFNLFRAPMLRAQFARREKWELRSISLIGVSDVPEAHRSFLVAAAADFFSRGRRTGPPRKPPRFEMAILVDPEDATPPSNPAALRNFKRAGERLGIGMQHIGKDDISRLPEYDGLFIRTTTLVSNYTYRFARRAEAEGLVVIDDSASIVKCTNKVYLAELLTRSRVAIPKTVIVHRENVEALADAITTPCILKRPDSSYSAGVIKVNSPEEFETRAREMLKDSDLIIAQDFIPTDFDWRVGVIDGRPLYVCKYFMADRHWQIVKRSDGGEVDEGRVETLDVDDAPPHVVRTALRATKLIGNGLYGVDLKSRGNTCCVIEVNDNPSIDAGFEDDVLKDRLYEEIMQVFLKRMEARTR